MEDDGVDLLAKLHQDEPVAEPELLHHDGNVASVRRLGAPAEDEVARIPGEDGDDDDDDDDDGDDDGDDDDDGDGDDDGEYLEKTVTRRKQRKIPVQRARATNQNQRKT